ncbi:MAG: peptide deformylase [Desulfobacter sp.]|nr:MAG: peptide deformylase [Desulfobacter sp.]
MAVLDIVKYPEKSLSNPSVPVEEIDDEILKLIEDMGETMFHDSGVGLAAPQVGINKRIIVYDAHAADPAPEDEEELADEDTEEAPKGEFTALINPEIISKSQETFISENEGCLSVVDYRADVKRHARVTVRALNIDGKKLEFDADGLLAVIMQHEIDHLDGILFIDRISSLKRTMYRKKRLKQLKKNN